MIKHSPNLPNVAIAAMGMVSPGGHSVDQTCATINSGISRINESAEFIIPNLNGERAPVLCGSVIGITDGQRRFLRHLRMAVPACHEALDQSGLSATDIQQSGLYLCLQEIDRPGMDNRPEQILAYRLSELLKLGDLYNRTQVFNKGHASVFYALEIAINDIVAGKYKYAIIGAIDTYLDEITLEWLQDVKRLKTNDNAKKGFIPGECAAFIVLGKESDLIKQNLTPLARLQGLATAMEPNSIYHDTPCQGEGLSTSIQSTIANLNGGEIHTGMVVCDLNGERYRSLEWGLALPRAMNNAHPNMNVVHPADCIGDLGAASGVVNICYAAVAIRKHYTTFTNALVWGSSDDGERGSVYVSAI